MISTSEQIQMGSDQTLLPAFCSTFHFPDPAEALLTPSLLPDSPLRTPSHFCTSQLS